ncbi:ABC transporter permease [Xanthomonas sp. GPE 39]|uniref:ABC transporter permease n=1 Tax=Xanthomonas sp. GPE 39 TaxID=1583099 RepID=UPI0005F2F39A|nr:ABC transporter permease [Xanthomonas sp. GPE 39]
MFKYYLKLGLRNLRRNPVLTLLMVMSIGFGVASSMTTYTVFRAVSGDPIPSKSSRLFFPQIDVWGPSSRRGDTEPADALTYTDVVALMRHERAAKQSAIYPVGPTLYPTDPAQKPKTMSGAAVHSDFFPMLEVPFLYGAGWSKSDEAQRSRVVVISKSLNQRTFGGENSVGREISLDNSSYRVIGVIGDWDPQPKFYFASVGYVFGPADDVFIPFATAIDQKIPTSGVFGCSAKLAEPGFAGALTSSCIWISYLVELDSPATVATYRDYLKDYARSHYAGWAVNNRLRDLRQFLSHQRIVSSETRLSMMVAICLLVVCMVNTVGLLLAKFLRRSSEIGVRRALGANRSNIAYQFGMESAAIGLAGGGLGLFLTWIGVGLMKGLLAPQIARLVHVDISLLLQTLILAIVTTVLAGLYPTWRTMHLHPSMQLKQG